MRAVNRQVRKHRMKHVPPFRADMVGSLLRTARLKAARAQKAAGAISAAQLALVEDAEITALIAQQEAIGLEAVTDGEFRRSWWHYDFFQHLVGVEMRPVEHGIQFAGVQTRAEAPHVVGKIDFAAHPFVEHFRFVKAHTTKMPKFTIPSPSMLHYRGGRSLIDATAYPDMEAFYADLAAAYRKGIMALYDAGCRYLQLDDVSFAYLCDPAQRAMLAARGDDPARQPQIYADMINQAIADRPSDLTITMHLCRGNFRSTFVASGGYEPVADLLFNGIAADGYFMEWDTDRAGGFEPLRLLPKGKSVVLGLVTSKSGTLEDKKAVLARIDDAARFAPLDQLCLSPQCGFASTEEGNTLAEEEQWAKLRLIEDIADEVWR
jgi:5-methyltetrahydropteroyltriglutamate--homocysteine methyltransferase